MSSSASGSKYQAPAAADNSQTPTEASSSQSLASVIAPRPPPFIVRYVCTVSQSCRRTFDNYNNWAQHETCAHCVVEGRFEDDARQKSSDAHATKRRKPEEQASASDKANELRNSNSLQRALAARKADALACTYDIWYCNGVDGCMDGWYQQADFERHFGEKHSMGWNKVWRSMRSSDYLLGPEHGVRMWCGFCHMVLEVSSKEKWYYDRLVHVASHFDMTCPDEIWYCDIFGWYFIEMH